MQLLVARPATRPHERARPGAQVLLGDHVRGGAELARQLDRVTAPHLQASPLVDAAAHGKHPLQVPQ